MCWNAWMTTITLSCIKKNRKKQISSEKKKLIISFYLSLVLNADVIKFNQEFITPHEKKAEK